MKTFLQLVDENENVVLQPAELKSDENPHIFSGKGVIQYENDVYRFSSNGVHPEEPEHTLLVFQRTLLVEAEFVSADD